MNRTVKFVTESWAHSLLERARVLQDDNGRGLPLRCLLEMGRIIPKCCFDRVLIDPDIYLPISPWASSTPDSLQPRGRRPTQGCCGYL